FDLLRDHPVLVLVLFLGRPAEDERLRLGLANVHAHDLHRLLRLRGHRLVEGLVLFEFPLEIDRVLAEGRDGRTGENHQGYQPATLRHDTFLRETAVFESNFFQGAKAGIQFFVWYPNGKTRETAEFSLTPSPRGFSRNRQRRRDL